MSKRLVTILWFIAGLLAVFTFVVKSQQEQGNETPTKLATGQTLLSDLPLKKIGIVEIKGIGDSVTITRDSSQWSVQEREGLKADFQKFTTLLRALTEMKVAQSLKAGPAFNERFGMDKESESADTHGYHVTFKDASGKELESLSVGKATSNDTEGIGNTGKYLRLGSDEESVYSVNAQLTDLNANPAEWLDKSFITVSPVKSVKMAAPNEEEIEGWALSRESENDDFMMKTPSKGRVIDSTKTGALKTILSAPRFTDILTAEQAKEQRNEQEARQLTLNTFDGFQYQIDYAPVKTKEGAPAVQRDYIIKVAVNAHLPKERVKREGETEEQAQTAEQEFAKNQQKLKSKLKREQEFTTRFYKFPYYVLAGANYSRSDLTKEAPKPAEPEPQIFSEPFEVPEAIRNTPPRTAPKALPAPAE